MVVKVLQPSLHYLAHNIGISGFKYLLGPDATAVRRFTWLLVIVAAMSWMVWNIHGRLAYFLSYPTSLETRITYQDRVAFPNIAICNQNQFRSSQVFKETTLETRKSPNFYQAMTEYYKAMTGRRNTEKVVKGPYRKFLASTGKKAFFDRMAHDMHTLVNKCTWKGLPCGPDDFKLVETDLGTCYRFHKRENNEHRFVDSAGHESGLSLTLMVEQYDYMRGSRDSAGAVVVIYPPDETYAFADSVGIGVTVGSKTAIALRKEVMRDMPAPHGSCGEKILTEVPSAKYTPLKCRLDCLTGYIRRKCGCVHIYMRKPNVPVCSLLDNLKCADKARKLFYSSGLTKQCECPTPCYSEQYRKTMSQSLLSEQYVNSLSLQASDDSSNSQSTNPSLLHVNQAVNIQAWGLLADTDPAYTDIFAKMAESLLDSRQTVESLHRSLTDFVGEIELIIYSSREELPEIEEIDKWDRTHDRTTNETVLMYTNYLERIAPNLLQQIDGPNFWTMNEFKWGLEATLAEDFLKPKSMQLTRVNHYIRFLKRVFTPITIQLKTLSEWAEMALHQSGDDADKMRDNNRTAMDAILKLKNLTEGVDRYQKDLIDMPSVTALVNLRQQLYGHLDASFYQANILSVDIFFEDMSVEDNVKTEAYSIEGLVCDIGGSIGLCLGGSILTFIEVFDLILFSRKKKSDKGLTSETAMQDLPEKKSSPEP